MSDFDGDTRMILRRIDARYAIVIDGFKESDKSHKEFIDLLCDNSVFVMRECDTVWFYEVSSKKELEEKMLSLMEKNKGDRSWPLYAAFVDFERAYDNEDLKVMFA